MCLASTRSGRTGPPNAGPSAKKCTGSGLLPCAESRQQDRACFVGFWFSFCRALYTMFHGWNPQRIRVCGTPATCPRSKISESSTLREGELSMTTDAEKMSIIARLDRAIELKNQTGQPAKGAPMPYVRAVETATAAGIIGYYEGRTGRRTLPGGVPLDVSVAAAGFGLGFLGLGGVGAEHAYAIGTAGLAVCAYNWGKQMGERMSGST